MSAQPGVVLVKEQNTVVVQSAFPIIPAYQNFSLTAVTNGQTAFMLPSYPALTGLFLLNINGVMQDALNGDFTINGNILTLNGGANAGDKLSGFYQVLQSGANSGFLNYRTFFFTAIQGQTLFVIGFVPSAILYITINGIVQSASNGDYTINGQNITLNQGLNAGDLFYGLALQ